MHRQRLQPARASPRGRLRRMRMSRVLCYYEFMPQTRRPMPRGKKMPCLLLSAVVLLWFPLACCCTAEAGTDSGHSTEASHHQRQPEQKARSSASCGGGCDTGQDGGESGAHPPGHHETCTCTFARVREQRLLDQPHVVLAPPVVAPLFVLQFCYEIALSDPLLETLPQWRDSNGPRGPGGDSLRAQHCLLTI